MNGFWGHYGKRIFDLVLALTLTAALLPIVIITAIMVRIKLGYPIFFTQRRIGKDAAEFNLYKFRSMTDERGHNGELLPDEVRLTQFGKLLRSTSIDELPQIINIINGEMSFIGPRATLPSYKNILLERYPERFKAMPGITSLPAIRGRNSLSWDEKFSMDVEYVQRFGFLLDMEICAKTIPVILGRKGISMHGSTTSTKYGDDTSPKN